MTNDKKAYRSFLDKGWGICLVTRLRPLLLMYLCAAATWPGDHHCVYTKCNHEDAVTPSPSSRTNIVLNLARMVSSITHDFQTQSWLAINSLLHRTHALITAVDDHNFEKGRTVIVHLFEWKWTDIAEECERFLGPFGYAGVQVSPPNEHRYVVIDHHVRPWWERYQPTGYRLSSRSGTDADFRDMVERCNAVGVRIYVDAVINHMAKAVSYDFPNVPFTALDFNVPKGRCPSARHGDGRVSNYYDVEDVRNCNLDGLKDIYYGPDNDYYTRDKVVQYLNGLLEMGVAGFRIDAAKHMWPSDLKNIYDRLQKTIWSTKPYIYQEVIDRSEHEAIRASEYYEMGAVTEFKYGDELSGLGSASKAAVWYSGFGEQWGLMPRDKALVFIDNHDNQRNHGGGGDIITHKTPYEYKKANAFMLAWDYGVTRVMSSYDFMDTDQGPPSDSNGITQSPVINADSTCGGGWICEHRWRQIRNMACFRNAAVGHPVQNWWDNGHNQIAFTRGSRAFFAMNNEPFSLSRTLHTALPAGVYCDVVSGDPTATGCTGLSVTVDSAGMANIDIFAGEDPMVAIHVGAKAGSGGGRCNW